MRSQHNKSLAGVTIARSDIEGEGKKHILRDARGARFGFMQAASEQWNKTKNIQEN